MPRHSAAALVSEAHDAPDADVPLSPARAKLKRAIDALAETESGIAEAFVAVTKANDDSRVAARALEEAQRELERAKPRSSTFTPGPQPRGAHWNSEEAYQAHVADQAAPPVAIGEARAAVERATDERDSAVRAGQWHQKHLDRLQEDLRFRRLTLNDAVRGVVKAEPALAALAAEIKRLTTRLASAQLAFSDATNADIIQPGSPLYGCDKPATFADDPEGWSISRAWFAALEGLKTNPATPLPVPEGADA